MADNKKRLMPIDLKISIRSIHYFLLKKLLLRIGSLF
jgi:hypothetical protein